MNPETVNSICRACLNLCSIDVVRHQDRVLEIKGNIGNELYRGYTCVKGRAQGALLRSESRLLRPLKKQSAGHHVSVPSARALDEIAEKLGRILSERGPRSIATYAGTMQVPTAPLSLPFNNAFMDSIGSSMRFDPNTIDKGGKQTAASYLGRWGAPQQGFDSPEVIMLIGINPWLTVTGFPNGAPARWLLDRLDEGCRLIVVDPRETEVASRADWFLQVAPGTDVLLLAAMIKIVVWERLYDQEFVAKYTRGLSALTDVLQSLDVSAAARKIDIPEHLLVGAARCYASADRGYVMAGTGPNMSGAGTIIEYLVLVLDTLCGRWLRAGETIRATPALLPTYPAYAQAYDPQVDHLAQEPLRIRGLRKSAAGMPTAALAEEILTPGEGQVRALISWGGNPVLAFPDQAKTVRALESLDLFVQIDPWYTESARLADYVFPPTLPMEVPATTMLLDFVTGRATGYGLDRAYAQYTPAVVPRPEGSDLLEEWEFFYELMCRMGFPVRVKPIGWRGDLPALCIAAKPTTDELIEMFASNSRVPLEIVKSHPAGHVYPEVIEVVQPSEEGHNGLLDIGSEEMLRHLRAELCSTIDIAPGKFPFRLLCRRANHVYNSSYNLKTTNHGIGYNPTYMNPEDMAAAGLRERERVLIASAAGQIEGFAHADSHLRRGLVSMMFAYGAPREREVDAAILGSSVNQLLRTDDIFDPYTGQPRMSNVPINVTRLV